MIMKNFDNEKDKDKAFRFSNYYRCLLFKGYLHKETKK